MTNRYCSQCGSQVAGDDRFCPACGASLTEETRRRHVAVTGEGAASKRLLSPLVLGGIVVAGMLMLAAGLLLREETPLEDVPPTSAAAIPFPNIPRIGLQEARERVQSGEAIFVDVRSAGDYAASHIADAVNVPLGPSALEPAYQDLPVGAELITYCT